MGFALHSGGWRTAAEAEVGDPCWCKEGTFMICQRCRHSSVMLYMQRLSQKKEQDHFAALMRFCNSKMQSGNNGQTVGGRGNRHACQKEGVYRV